MIFDDLIKVSYAAEKWLMTTIEDKLVVQAAYESARNAPYLASHELVSIRVGSRVHRVHVMTMGRVQLAVIQPPFGRWVLLDYDVEPVSISVSEAC